MDPLRRCCCAAAMSRLDGRSVKTCSRVQPPLLSLTCESEKRHFRFGTTPLSVDAAPRLLGLSRSTCSLVPPRSGPPFPSAEMGWPCTKPEPLSSRLVMAAPLARLVSVVLARRNLRSCMMTESSLFQCILDIGEVCAV